MATFSPESSFCPSNTVPYVPSPSCDNRAYRFMMPSVFRNGQKMKAGRNVWLLTQKSKHELNKKIKHYEHWQWVGWAVKWAEEWNRSPSVLLSAPITIKTLSGEWRETKMSRAFDWQWERRLIKRRVESTSEQASGGVTLTLVQPNFERWPSRWWSLTNCDSTVAALVVWWWPRQDGSCTRTVASQWVGGGRTKV